MCSFRSVFLDFLWIQPTDFDIALSVASSDTKESIFEADMVPQIRGTKFEQAQGRVLHGDFGRIFGDVGKLIFLSLTIGLGIQR